MGIQQQIGDNNWSSNLSVSNYSATDTMKYQWEIGYRRPWNQVQLKTAALLQYTIEDQAARRQSDKLRLRVTLEKDWFQDLAKSYFVMAYQNNDGKNPCGTSFSSEVLSFEGSLNIKFTTSNVIKLSGKVSFWENSSNFRGTDYSLALLWQARLF